MVERGMSLVEVMVTLAIAAVLLGLGLQFFGTMLATTHTRAAADSIAAGLQLARAEAIKRNAPMRFQLVSVMTSSCTYNPASMLWVVTQTDQASRGQVAGACEAAPYLPPDQPDPCNPDPGVCPSSGTMPADCRPIGNPASCADDPWVAFKSSGNISPDVTVTSTTVNGGATAASIVTFGPIGQVLANIGGAATLGFVKVAPTRDTAAKTWGIRISGNGSIKLCDPSKAATDPMGC